MTLNQQSTIDVSTAVARLCFSVRTDVGNVRKVNEDSVLAQSPVFLVADGMGGHAQGEVASQTVLRVFDEHIERDLPSTPERILDAIHSSNDAVRDLSAVGDFGTAVSGTTLAGIAFVDAGDDVGYHWMVFNVGDSRVYTWSDGVLTQLSVDHSAVQEMVEAGLISSEDAQKHPERNVITRAIGADEFVDADVWLLPAVGEHTFLICSDGLTKELDDDSIARVLAMDIRLDAAGRSVAEILVDEAIDHGGNDNVSVVYVASTFG
jgi:serine/threonine protein phosphatase PrpC